MSGGVAVDFDLGLQSDEDQAAEGEGAGFEAGGVLGQAQSVIDDGNEFGASGSEVDEGRACEVTPGRWRGIGSAIGPQVRVVVGGLREGRFEFSEPGGVV